MSELAQPNEIFVTTDQLAPIFKLYDQGLYVQAYNVAETIGPLALWRGASARVLAGRLAGNLGSLRLGEWHFIHAHRRNRRDPEAMWYFVRYLLGRRGPYAAWRFVQAHEFPADAPATLRSHWLSQQAAILGFVRDFNAAEDCLRRAEVIGEEAWTCLEWANLYNLEDRHDEAEHAARRALQKHPWYRPAVQWVAHFLVQKQRDDEAIDFLTQATQQLESASVHAQLAMLLYELKRYDEAAIQLDANERLSPLLGKNERQWLTARRCDLACRDQQFDQALDLARQVKGPFYESIAKRLTAQTELGPRVELPVGYVRQHHKTCAPETLTSIAKFWTMPAEHVEVAEEISYAGTPSHSERQWAEDHGFYAKAFTVTWESTVSLIDRGIPFTLTTTEVQSGHLQAVIGYDAARGTLIIRDPMERHQREIPFDLLVKRYRATGPRGMAIIPIAVKDRLAALLLPDDALHDLMHRFDMALKDHRRAEAELIVAAMVKSQPGHFMTIVAQRTLTYYDNDPQKTLFHTDQLLKLFPNDSRLEYDRSWSLRQLSRREERLAILKRLSERKDTDPAYWQQYAAELMQDARETSQAHYLLRKAARANLTASLVYSSLAWIRTNQRKFDEAYQLFHFAVCLEERDELLVRDYIQAARTLGKIDHALQLLQQRFQRFGTKTSQPARNLFFALEQAQRMTEAFDVLDLAIAQRPGDGDLLVSAADACMLRGELTKASELLDRANGVSKPGLLLRAQARLAYNLGDTKRTHELWRQVLDLEPLAEDAHRNYVQTLAESESKAAAVAHIKAACKRFPHHIGLSRLWYDLLFDEGPEAREPILKRIIDVHPADAWARREYALNLADQNRAEEAIFQCDEAEPLEPHSPYLWSCRAYVFKKASRIEDAKHAYREALRLSIDLEIAIQDLIALSDNLQDRRDSVAFIEQQLNRQMTFGDALLAFHDAVAFSFPPEELLASLKRGLEARPDLWQAWSAAVRQLITMERAGEALSYAQKQVQRFPHLPGIWLDLADAHRANKNTESEMTALQRAIELAPSWPDARRMLADGHERAGALDKAKAILEESIQRSPLDSFAHFDYAEFLMRRQDYDGAIAKVRQALVLNPRHDVAWSRLCEWCSPLDRADEVVSLAREWTAKRSGESHLWMRLGQALQWQGELTSSKDEAKRIDDCIAAYDEAIRRNPHFADVYDMKAQTLAQAGKHEDAQRTCNAAVWKGKPPLFLRGRLAWIKAVEGDLESAKKEMGDLLKEDPNYQWGWNQLVEWCWATGQHKEYLDAANQMLRIRPQSARAMAYRGEARIRMGEREAGLEDLKIAQRRDPCNQRAAFVLFDEQVIDNDLNGAEATLATMQQNISGDAVKARQIQMLLKCENQTPALEKWEALCATHSPFTDSLDLAMRAFDLAEAREPAEKVLREAMERPNWNLHLAILYAGRWNPNLPNDLPERIAVVDRALEREPESIRFLEMKIDLLCQAAQYERAWQVCQTRTFPRDQFRLQARAAWVMYCSGRTADGFTALRALLKEHPKFYWGWQQLADWHSRAQQWVELLTVAEQMVLIAPRDPIGFGWRGLAKHNLGDSQAARTDYLHGLDLQVAYAFGAWQLFYIYMSSGEWKRAETLLDKTEKHVDPGEIAWRRVELLVYQNKKAKFPAEFEKLCKHSTKMPWIIDNVLNLLWQAGWASDAEKVLHRCLDLGPQICDAWVRLRLMLGDRIVGSDIQNMSSQRPERTNCIAAYAIELAYAKDAVSLRNWIAAHDDELRADTPNWAKIGVALAIVADRRGVCEWMSDWNEHPKALPGNLLTLVKAMRSLDQREEANEVSDYALTKLNPDHAASSHKLWLMFDQALTGDVLHVQRYFENADLGGFDPYHHMISYMAQALLWTTNNTQTGFSQARQLLYDAARHSQPMLHDPALALSYQACVSRMAELHGTFGAKLWRVWRWLFPKLPPPPPKPIPAPA